MTRGGQAAYQIATGRVAMSSSFQTIKTKKNANSRL